MSRPLSPAPWPGLPSLQEHAAVGAELRHLHAFRALRRGIGDPEIAVLVDGRLVRFDEEAGAEILQCLAVGSEFDDRNAVVRFTTVHGPEVVVRIDRHGIDRTPGPRRRGPILDLAVGIGQVAVGLRAGIALLRARHSGGDDGRKQRYSKSRMARSHIVPPLVLRELTRQRGTLISGSTRTRRQSCSGIPCGATPSCYGQACHSAWSGQANGAYQIRVSCICPGAPVARICRRNSNLFLMKWPDADRTTATAQVPSAGIVGAAGSR